jgi:CBS domain-containing protein
MTTDLVTLSPDASVQEAAALMKKFNIGTILITENNKLAGILTDRDIVIRLVAENIAADKSILKDFMTQSPVIISSDTDIHTAASIMAEHQIRRLPVVKDEKLTGIVTLGDLASKATSEAETVLQFVSKPTRREVSSER